MKKLLSLSFLTLTILGFYSCSTVGFKAPVPTHQNNITYFPKKWIGNYITSKNDTIRIEKKYFTIDVLGKRQKINLNDTVFLRKLNNKFWCLNIGNKNNEKLYWFVVPIKEKRNKLQFYTIEFGQKTIDKLEKLNIPYILTDKTTIIITQTDSATIEKMLDKNIFSKYGTMKKIQ